MHVVGPLAYVRTESGVVQLQHGQDVPADADPVHVAELTRRGVLEQRGSDENPDTVAAIVKAVGDDPEKARAALESERGRSDGPRSSLVEKLEAVIAKAG